MLHPSSSPTLSPYPSPCLSVYPASPSSSLLPADLKLLITNAKLFNQPERDLWRLADALEFEVRRVKKVREEGQACKERERERGRAAEREGQASQSLTLLSSFLLPHPPTLQNYQGPQTATGSKISSATTSSSSSSTVEAGAARRKSTATKAEASSSGSSTSKGSGSTKSKAKDSAAGGAAAAADGDGGSEESLWDDAADQDMLETEELDAAGVSGEHLQFDYCDPEFNVSASHLARCSEQPLLLALAMNARPVQQAAARVKAAAGGAAAVDLDLELSQMSQRQQHGAEEDEDEDDDLMPIEDAADMD